MRPFSCRPMNKFSILLCKIKIMQSKQTNKMTHEIIMKNISTTNHYHLSMHEIEKQLTKHTCSKIMYNIFKIKTILT